jgi:hypothetical protein
MNICPANPLVWVKVEGYYPFVLFGQAFDYVQGVILAIIIDCNDLLNEIRKSIDSFGYELRFVIARQNRGNPQITIHILLHIPMMVLYVKL